MAYFGVPEGIFHFALLRSRDSFSLLQATHSLLKKLFEPRPTLRFESLAYNGKAIYRWLAKVSPKGFEPPSSEPESDILSIELRRQCGKDRDSNPIFFAAFIKNER